MSSYAIHQRLTVQGIPPRKSSQRGWAQSSVIEILRDSIYKGEAYYNRTQPGDVRRPYGPHGLKDRRPGNGQGRTRRPQVGAFCASVRGALAEPSFEVQHKVVQLVVDWIVVEDKRVVIEHVVPTGPVRFQPEHLAPGGLGRQNSCVRVGLKR